MRVAFLLAFGPEFRAFFHSGLAATLEEMGHEPLALLVVPVDELPDVEYPVIRMIPDSLPVWVGRLSGLCDAAHESLLERRRLGARWRLVRPVGSQRSAWSAAARVLARVGSTRTLLRWAEGVALRRLGRVSQTARELGEGGIEAIVTSSYSSPRALPVLNAACSIGIPCVALTNSWKDVHVKRRLPVWPALVGVWDDSLRRDLIRFNPGFPTERVVATGSLHLRALLDTKVYPDRPAFCRHIGFDPARPLICYSAASPRAVPNEEGIVGELVSILRDWPGQHRPQLIIRSNPMGGAERFDLLVRDNDFVALSLPSWRWNADRDWCQPLPQDLPVWRAMIEHSAVNVSAASTVTLEFALFGKPVINPCFGPGGNPSEAELLQRLWDAPFYRSVREANLATRVTSRSELVRSLTAALTNGENPGRLRDEGAAGVASLELVAARVQACFERRPSSGLR